MSRETYNYKRYAIKAAKDLMYLYPIKTIVKLQNATTESEIERIMISARKERL